MASPPPQHTLPRLPTVHTQPNERRCADRPPLPTTRRARRRLSISQLVNKTGTGNSGFTAEDIKLGAVLAAHAAIFIHQAS